MAGTATAPRQIFLALMLCGTVALAGGVIASPAEADPSPVPCQAVNDGPGKGGSSGPVGPGSGTSPVQPKSFKNEPCVKNTGPIVQLPQVPVLK
jgi:hypothetical protein